MRKPFVITTLCLTVLLTACGSDPKQPDYQAAAPRAPLEVPPDLNSLPPSESVGVATASGEAERSGLSAPGRASDPIVRLTSRILPTLEGAVTRRAGQIRWIEIKAEPENLWLTARQFFIKLGFKLSKEHPETGIMETDWQETRPLVTGEVKGFFERTLGSLYSTSIKNQFRMRLERGQQPGVMEVYFSHQRMEEVVAAGGATDVVDTRWQPVKPDPDKDVEIMQLFLVHLGAGSAEAKSLAQAPEAIQVRASLAKDNNKNKVIRLTDSGDDAWRRLGLGLDRAGFTVQDRDRGTSVYYVRYIDPARDTKPGFFSRMFSSASEDSAAMHLQVRLRDEAPGSVVDILDKDGEPVLDSTRDRIFGLLLEQLKY